VKPRPLAARLPDLAEMAAWAIRHDCEAREVFAWPDLGAPPFHGSPGKSVVCEDSWDVLWWRYRVPALGDVDKVHTGLKVAHRIERPLIVA
jgi:hypothetical protein